MEFVKINNKENYAIVQINRPSANTINLALVEELRTSFKDIQSDDSVRGVILTGLPRFFSAGLDVIELYDYDKEKIRTFFHSFSSLHIELARFTKPLICAINGHAPAGGTVLAITADYRIMVEGEKYSIGLNEVAVNIQISQMLVNAYSFWIGKGLAHKYLLNGQLLNGQEALSANLIDELVSEEKLMDRAENQMQHFLNADPEIFKNTKLKLRKYWLEKIEEDTEDDLAQALAIWEKPEVKMKIKMLVDFLKSRKKQS